MPYHLRPTIEPRERILTFGGAGTRKSSSILEVARRCPNDMFYVLDTDFGSYDRLLASPPETYGFSDLRNVDVTCVDEWTEFIEVARDKQAKMRRDDWLVVDMMTSSWDAVQGYFVEQVHGKDIDEYFLSVRSKKQSRKEAGGDEKGGFGAISGEDGDWQVINKLYFKFYNQLLKTPGHLYLCAEQDTLGKREEKETRETFGGLGYKPKGQKRLGHVPSTVLWMKKAGVGEWEMTTAKDRGRLELDSVKVENFALDYLVKCGGWRMVSTDA